MALIGVAAEWLRDRRRLSHERLLAAEQREHEMSEKRYDDVRAVYLRFATEMRKVVDRAEGFQMDLGYTYGSGPGDPEPWDVHQPGPEQALAELQLLAGAELYEAAGTWLKRYYEHWWHAATPEEQRKVEVRGAEEQYVVAGRRALGLTG
ncbi:hypothetical protein [uncultured Cellulomonas sp.]|uniref:hypothetical protein n=1 Tax=uncultured Cellulomonas sp. TaxID=189682 RepID=UPI00262BDE70|nr:hypothetical protein [uncultured Cellulomonas sp.]